MSRRLTLQVLDDCQLDVQRGGELGDGAEWTASAEEAVELLLMGEQVVMPHDRRLLENVRQRLSRHDIECQVSGDLL